MGLTKGVAEIDFHYQQLDPRAKIANGFYDVRRLCHFVRETLRNIQVVRQINARISGAGAVINDPHSAVTEKRRAIYSE